MSDPSTPIFLCTGTFNKAMLTSFVEFYNQLLKEKKDHAFIYINSPGGEISVVNSMLSIIEGSKITFHTVAVGMAASCGCLLLAGGDVRYATNRAEICFHDMRAGGAGRPDVLEYEAKRYTQMEKDLKTKFAKRTKKPFTWWKTKVASIPTRDFWFHAKEAETLGVIDHIGLPTLKKSVQLQIEII